MSGGYRTQIDGISFRLRDYHDFSWLGGIGRVFRVFAEQDSGNISFGVEAQDNKKLFIKYAGAPTSEYRGGTSDAVRILRRAAECYEVLRHPNLSELVHHGEMGNGYALIFPFIEGECLHAHWMFDESPKWSLSNPFGRHRALPLEKRLKTLDIIYDFHCHTESKGYVAVDFYDGSIIYDFDRDETHICDIDLYEKRPYINRTGVMWGSDRFKSPEERTAGALIDERTTVYNMGAAAFCFLGGEYSKEQGTWEAPEPLYRIARRAVQDNPDDRYKSVAEFYDEWKKAL